MSLDNSSLTAPNLIHVKNQSGVMPIPSAKAIGNFSVETATMFDKTQNAEAIINGKGWNEKAVDWLSDLELELERKWPNYQFQNVVDEAIKKIEDTTAPLNNWINSNGCGNWLQKLGTFLAKLPIRVVRNILMTVYNVVKATVYSFVHPIKAFLHFGKMVIEFIHSLTEPVTLVKLGSSIFGASLGRLTLIGGPYSLIGIGIGALLILIGIGAGSISALVKLMKYDEDMDVVSKKMQEMLEVIPESLLTGFVMGVIVGGVQKHLLHTHGQQVFDQPSGKLIDLNTARDYVNNHFISDNHLSTPTTIDLNSNGTIVMTWKGEQLRQLVHTSGNPIIHTFDFRWLKSSWAPSSFRMELVSNQNAQFWDGVPHNINYTSYLGEHVYSNFYSHYPTIADLPMKGPLLAVEGVAASLIVNKVESI